MFPFTSSDNQMKQLPHHSNYSIRKQQNKHMLRCEFGSSNHRPIHSYLPHLTIKKKKKNPISFKAFYKILAALYIKVSKHLSGKHLSVTKILSMERSKKKVLLWKKAIVHFALCFVMGFFTGFAPTGKSSSPIFSSQISPKNSPEQVEMLPQKQVTTTHANNVNRSLVVENPVPSPSRSKESEGVKLMETEAEAEAEAEEKEETNLVPRRLVIIVTPTSTRDKSQVVLLRRLANTIKLVSPPLLWIVVERKSDSDEVSELLRKTGIMYRHLVFKENFTDHEAELDHQRNVALKHIEHHRLSGIVHFAGVSNVYDLAFFDELRDIEYVHFFFQLY